MMPLAFLSAGESAEVVRLGVKVRPQDESSLRLASDMGLRCGQRVEMLSNSGGGPILLKVDSARLAIGRSLAHQVLVDLTGGGEP